MLLLCFIHVDTVELIFNMIIKIVHILILIIDPIQTQSREDLSIWLCHRHNLVNHWLGKPEFDCSFENIEKRWKIGSEACKNLNKG